MMSGHTTPPNKEIVPGFAFFLHNPPEFLLFFVETICTNVYIRFESQKDKMDRNWCGVSVVNERGM